MTLKPADLDALRAQQGWQQVRDLIAHGRMPAAVAQRALDSISAGKLDVPQDIVSALKEHAADKAVAATTCPDDHTGMVRELTAPPPKRPVEGKAKKESRNAVPTEIRASFAEMVGKTFAAISPPIKRLQAELGELEKKDNELRIKHNWMTWLAGKKCDPEDLPADKRAQYDALVARKAAVRKRLDQLGDAGRLLTALRGRSSVDDLSVTVMAGVAVTPLSRWLKGVLSGDYWLGATMKKRDETTGERDVTLTHQFSVDCPWGSLKWFPGYEGLGYALTPLPYLYMVRDTFFGTNLGVRIPGFFFAGVTKRPDGGAAIEIGGNPLIMAGAVMRAVALATANAPVLSTGLVLGAMGAMVGPYGGALVEHPSLAPTVDRVMQYWQPVVSGLENAIASPKKTWNGFPNWWQGNDDSAPKESPA